MEIGEFSLAMSQSGVEDWYRWFSRRRIPVAMVEHSRRRDLCVVWRGFRNRTKSDPWKKEYRVIKKANNFPIPA